MGNIDGHFWVQMPNGDYIDPSPMEGIVSTLKGAKPFYKRESDEVVVELACKIAERVSAKIDGEYKAYCCYWNSRLYIERHGGTIVFGVMGFYFRKGASWNTEIYCGKCPRKSVWWIYGSDEYTTIAQYFQLKHKDFKYHSKIKNTDDPKWIKNVEVL